jgi:hypothetical protein
MSSLEDRPRRLEEKLIAVPTADEYLAASNREEVRAPYELAEQLAPYGFCADYLFTAANRRMLREDTAEKRKRDGEL